MVDRLPTYVTKTNLLQKKDSTQFLDVPRHSGEGICEAQVEAVVSALRE